MRFDPPETEARRAFSKANQHAILLRQAIKGADGIFRAHCAGDGCDREIAMLMPTGQWRRIFPFAFDHIRELSAGGLTTADNGQALCDGPNTCHAKKTASWAAMQARADRMGGRTGQAARRAARKASGQRGPWGKR